MDAAVASASESRHVSAREMRIPGTRTRDGELATPPIAGELVTPPIAEAASGLPSMSSRQSRLSRHCTLTWLGSGLGLGLG